MKINDEEVEVEGSGSEFDEDDEDEYADDIDYGYASTDSDVFNENDKRAADELPCIESNESRADKVRKCDTNPCLDRQWMPSSSGLDGIDLNVSIWPEGADICNLPPLGDDLEVMNLPKLPTEVVESMIIARTSLLEIMKLCTVNKRIWTLITSGELARERKRLGIKEKLVLMLTASDTNWKVFDQKFTICREAPLLPSDYTFKLGDKETLCVGTQLLVIGIEFEGSAIFIYDVVMNKWLKGTPMNDSRHLFASASTGDFAYVAGGCPAGIVEVVNSAEKYDPVKRSWELLPSMHEKRRLCSGVYMDDKFYVIGGTNVEREPFSCAEVFDEKKNTWVKIPGMLTGLTNSSSPPLVAAVNNELYLFETLSNCLLLYLKENNSWKDLGPIPVTAGISKGWGVAVKSLGDELLVIGRSNLRSLGSGMVVITCRPNPNAEKQEWKVLDDGRNPNHRSSFILNCAVMIA